MATSTKDPFLLALGERVRLLRARRGLTRKSVAKSSGVSERHLANLEYGVGNASILVLQQVAAALDCDLAELVGDVSTSSPEWLMLRETLRGKSDVDLRRARRAIAQLFGSEAIDPARGRRIALIGLRGAGAAQVGVALAPQGLSQHQPLGRAGRDVADQLGEIAVERAGDLLQDQDRRVADAVLEVGEVPLGNARRGCDRLTGQPAARAQQANALAEGEEERILGRCRHTCSIVLDAARRVAYRARRSTFSLAARPTR